MPTKASVPRTRSRRPGKRSTNPSPGSDVLAVANDRDNKAFPDRDDHLSEVVRREQVHRWCEEHAEFIAAYNATIHAAGLPLEEWRSY